MMEKGKIFKRVIAGFLSFSMLAGCANSESQEVIEEEDTGNWAVYLYLCGSDLESRFASATNNLAALCNSSIGEDTQFVIETGGTTEWQNELVSEGVNERWVLETDGTMTKVDEVEQSNMGDPKTLENFLKFATENYPAEKTMVILWNHGGGTNGGCCIDENFEGDFLTLQEMHEAFKNSLDFTQDKKPIDILGFDACLMASLDVADMYKDCASYLVASQEEEPSFGWDYETISNSLGENPEQSPVELGTVICDSYLSNLEKNDSDETATLSLVDLSKVDPVKEKLEFLADEMLMSAYGNPKFFQSYAIEAKNAENYGGNKDTEGYSNMVDIQSFAQQASENFESALDVIDSLEECVIHQVQGPYRGQGGGLSFFYNYTGDPEANDVYKEQGCLPVLRTLYDVGISKKLDKEEKAVLKELDLNEKKAPIVETFDSLEMDYPNIQFNKKDQMYVDFGDEIIDTVVNASYNLFYYNADGELVYIGSDNDEVDFSLDSGLITKLGNTARWLYIGDTLVYSRLDYTSPGYNLYSIPVLVDVGNGKEKAYLQIAFDFEKNDWFDMGYRLEGTHMAVGNRTMYFDEGQEVTLLEEVFDENDDIIERELKTVTYSDSLEFSYKELPDAEYLIEFRIEDIYGHYFFSNNESFIINQGKISYPNKK